VGDISRIGVIGLGTMGAGIAEVFARSGRDVVGVEVDDGALAVGRGHVERSTGRAVTRGKLSVEKAAEIMGRITFAPDLGALADCELVLEVVPERLELKRTLLGRLDDICPPATILATNTSSLSVTDLAMATARPERVIGMHFFNPAPVMRLVEIVRTLRTDPSVVADVQALAAGIGKTGVTVLDRAGFVANWLLFGYLNSAVTLLESHTATREDIDTAMRLGCGLPMGPFALLDVIGLDTSLAILETMYAQSGEHRHAPAPLLRQLVTAGWLGRKTGRGFWTYPVVASADAAPGSERAPAAEPAAVQRVGVVGGSELTDRLAELAGRSGFEVLLPAGDAFGGLADCDLVIEAASDSSGPELCAALDGVLAPGAILATTSTPVVASAAATGRPDRVVGLRPHGAEALRLVEVIPAITTSAETVATAYDVAQRLGLSPVAAPDTAGGIVNRLLFPYLNDAVALLEAGYASAEDIDAAMTLGCGYPVGPFGVLDAVGPEVALEMLQRLHREFRQPAMAPASLLRQLVTVGRGFRDRSGR